MKAFNTKDSLGGLITSMFFKLIKLFKDHD